MRYIGMYVCMYKEGMNRWSLMEACRKRGASWTYRKPWLSIIERSDVMNGGGDKGEEEGDEM